MPNININDLNYNIFRIPIAIKKLYLIMFINLSVKIKNARTATIKFHFIAQKIPELLRG